jgi:phage tail sheath gpL-like
MPVAFNQIPLDIRTPGQFVEFDASKAISGLPAAPNKTLIIGQKLAAGTQPQLVPLRIQSDAQASAAFGRASILDRMVRLARKADPLTELWVVAQDDLGAGAQAAGTITVTGNGGSSGTIAMMIAGQSVPVGVTVGQTAAQIGTNIAVAINAAADLPVTAAANGAGVVTITARHKGTCGNDIDIRFNYYQGDVTPTNVGLALVAMAGGAGNPDIAAALAALGEGEQYRAIILGCADVATLGAVEIEMASRWGPMRQIEGLAYAALKGSYGTLSASGAARNSPYDSIPGANKSPSPPWEWAASWGAVTGFALANDPARPCQTLSLPGILPPAPGDRFTRAERDLLLRDGISTWTVGQDGTVMIERAITTFQTNVFGIDDLAWLDINTPATVAYLRFSLRARISSRYPRHKLASDGTNFGPGQFIVTPKIIKAEIIALAREWELAGLVEDMEEFKRDLIVERDATDQNRVNALIPPNLVNQLRIFAGRIEFRL